MTRPSPSTVTDEGLDVQQVFALEGADELEQLGKRAQGMISAIPAIVAEERIEQHNAIYESDAKRWFRLAAGVRACVEASSHAVTDERLVERVAESLWLHLDLNGHTLEGIRRAASRILDDAGIASGHTALLREIEGLREALTDIRNRVLCPVGPSPTIDELQEIASAALSRGLVVETREDA